MAQPNGEDSDPAGKSLTSMPAPSNQMLPNPANLSWNPSDFLPWDTTNPLSWNNPSRHPDGTRKDGLYEKSTKALSGSAPGMEEPVGMIENSVPLSWPQDEPLSWSRPERDERGERKDGLYEQGSRAMEGAVPRDDDQVTMIDPPVPLSFPQDEPLSWNRAERDEDGKRKDGLYEEKTKLVEKPVPLSWDQRQPLSWNNAERDEDGGRKDGLYEEGTQMIRESVPLSWDQRKPLSWDADRMFVEDENLKPVGFVGVEQEEQR